MPGFFYELGKKSGPKVRKAQWVWHSFFGGSEEQVIAAENLVGQDLAAEVFRHAAVCPDADLGTTISDLGARLARRLVDQRRRFRFYIVEMPSPNAFALPGGYVFVTRSMLDLCQDHADRRSFVLAHEMAHVVRGHAMKRIVAHSAVTFATGLAPARSAIAAWARRAGISAAHGMYSQDQELEADHMAVLLIRAAGYDGAAAERLMLGLARASSDRGPQGLGRYFSSHPPFEERVRAIGRVLRNAK